ncbi:MAG: preprotein translocase subunit SecA [Gammaproteobacteria bacterium]|nr:preprotein translocase subunit SecA [Gammaproteobacteria bacterium]NIM74915.1 preprotein translocase subunit SecA [Gammaproteobacteria bacterium]NIN39704.1 preprotein translocase subunit SecA [Gammaproteobacteria bacterium]NIO26832.1 preprotein translocase subunit SecA [Gammaproteobacteria bacterium]NIO67388.1 preprotein translocase subunit SecA [Gammaproteobacteria bacterium]
MITKAIRKIVGSRNERQVRRMRRMVEGINALEADVQKLSDAELRARTDEFRQRRAAGESLESLLPEAFATVREAARRTLDMRHFDVQLVGGIALHEGHIAEMRTGEGKTLVATLPAYLNALDGNGVHIVTVNDYLARRDAAWMGHIYEFLGMRTGVVVPGMLPQEKQQAYAADVVYGTNNEYGFDYLRDNMAFMAAERTQGPLHYAIVDEVDSILIDEARTPLIISGPTDENSDLYVRVNRLIPSLKRQEVEDGPGDYSVDEKAKQVYLTEEGHQRVEQLLEEEGMLEAGQSLYDASNIVLMHHLMAALRAHALFTRNVDYIVKDNEIVIVDEFTGRTMPGRRWSEGLHQAMEAKEGVPIQNENQTLASITFQNYFRLYDKLAGMTGTADTEAPEFQQIYGLEVIVIPTHMDMIREDFPDLVYLSKDEKFEAILEDIRDCRERGQPALVGTASIETSEYLSSLLAKESIPHQVLNAKQHAREAEIIMQAGRPGTITIATNMAGRGTDIVLGGNVQAEIDRIESPEREETSKMRADWKKRHEAVLEAGGLHIIGTERHESRRIDNQLRGRSGRQGDVGSSRFYLSLEDDLMRIFASDRVSAIMQKLGMQRGEAIEHPWVTKAIENAQRKVESRNFDIRKQLLEYDDVANDQRKEVYALRSELMSEDDVSDRITQIRENILSEVIDTHIAPHSLDEQWDVPGLEESLKREFDIDLDISGWLAADDELHEEPLRQRILDEITAAYEEKKRLAGEEVIRNFEKAVMLQVLDTAWKEHLAAMDYLRQGIHLRGYAQKNPKQEYKREAFEMFQGFTERIKYEVINLVSKVRVREESDVEAMEEQRRMHAPVSAVHPSAAAMEAEAAEADPVAAAVADEVAKTNTPFKRPSRKIGRNEPCPCGSGKKYKQCHGRIS